jgi:hypothetical protein
VASYRAYDQAQRAVDYLADRKFPVERVSIVAEGLNFVEQVTGRAGYGSAAISGAVTGAATGALFGFIFGLFDLVTPLVSGVSLALYGLVLGAVVGLILGLIGQALTRGQRNFNSVGGVRADRYNVLVDDEVADEAARMLSNLR